MPRTRPLRTEAIVLRQRPIGDADKVCVLLSPAHGRIEAVARGVRKTTSRLAGHVEALSRGSFQLAQGRSMYIVTQAQTLDAWPGLHDDIDRLSLAVGAAELIDRTAVADLGSRALYELTRKTLSRIAETGEPAAAARWFRLRWLDQQGYQPELNDCVRCRATLEPEGNGLAALEGGVVCPDCHRAGAGAPLSSTAFKLLRYMRRSSFDLTAQVRLSAAAAAEVDRHLSALVEHALDGRLRSSSFARALEGAGRGARVTKETDHAAV